MKIRTKQLSALAMLPIVFILISFTTVQKTEPQASGKPVINISQASVFTVRDHSENAPLNPVRYPDFIVTNWQLAKLQLATSMHEKPFLVSILPKRRSCRLAIWQLPSGNLATSKDRSNSTT